MHREGEFTTVLILRDGTPFMTGDEDEVVYSEILQVSVRRRLTARGLLRKSRRLARALASRAKNTRIFGFLRREQEPQYQELVW